MRPLLAALMLFALPAAAHAGPTGAERTMMQTVTQEHDRHIALLERMVNRSSLLATLMQTGSPAQRSSFGRFVRSAPLLKGSSRTVIQMGTASLRVRLTPR